MITITDIAINHATIRKQADMTRFIELCVERDIKTISIWGDEVDRVGERTVLPVLQEIGLRVLGYNRLGPFEPKFLDRTRMELERAARFGADHVMVFTGGIPGGQRDLATLRRQHEDCIGKLRDEAASFGVTLALEPLHPMLFGDRTTLASLSRANDLCDALGEGVGIVIDVHHVWWDERLEAEVARAGAARRIVGFHVNDWLLPTKHLLRDRGMMGDGIIDLAAIERMVRRAGYGGPIEVEIFSDDWDSRAPETVLDIAIERCLAIF
ncbi:sugar phosphate isomerase/epimerase [Sinorhizobium terangae]|uniref:TIM barrel protein n=1 Tax=Sinorhizobium terangae TaxID=110322 RepID=A0A6N7LFN1_SINTE|nr:sugar phosphate isomerase/epimerase family protein [Sinorhizobium terangae]MBB4188798.1 sugar phosphate isomerase/epimerase [Sinorhizobium terangae]MQX16607.1 TIM barrel protein [Sinorhizobium terangae]